MQGQNFNGHLSKWSAGVNALIMWLGGTSHQQAWNGQRKSAARAIGDSDGAVQRKDAAAGAGCTTVPLRREARRSRCQTREAGHAAERRTQTAAGGRADGRCVGVTCACSALEVFSASHY